MDYFSSYGFAGTYFVVFGLWNLSLVCRRYHACRRRGLKYTSSTSYSWDNSRYALLRIHPVESYIKIVTLLSGMALEIVMGTKDGWNTSGLQHVRFATIYFFLSISALTDIFVHYLSFTPFNLEYLCLLFSFFVEWILVRFPREDRPMLDQLLYTLLEYVVFATVMAVAMEMHYRSHTTVAIIRSYFMILQGTWLWQMSFILWKPSLGLPWKSNDQGDITLACLFFAWHNGGTLVLVFLVSGLVTFISRGNGLMQQQQRKKDETLTKSLIKPQKNGKTIISLGSYDDDDDDDDDESDVEFQRLRK